ncbi:MAG TPA: ABC transporter ATP-binding protein [Thermoanaerobaculia bacterium]|nr:ABC transporter ATP-binding protein [Thermoanaerobaculia bacterium]
MTRAVEARGLRHRFGRTVALDGVDLTLEPGEIAGYVGPNGSGKTTTMRALLGLLHLDEGELRIFGHDVRTGMAVIGPLLGAVFDRHALHPHLTVRETLVLYARLYRAPRARVDEVLDAVRLRDRAGSLVKTLSKGLSQRLAFGRAILHRPKLLLLDEPFDGIDAETLRDLRALLRGLAGEGTAILLASHDLHEVEQLATQVVILRRGSVVAEGRPSQLVRGFGTLEAAYFAHLQEAR